MNKILYNKITFIFLSIVSLILLSSFVYRILISQPITPLVDDKKDTAFNKQIQLNILNACGESGVAAKFKEYYRIREFDVVEIGNFNKEIEKSMVLDRIGDIRSAFKVAQLAGINDSLVKSVVDSTMYLRTTLVIGKDWKNLEILN